MVERGNVEAFGKEGRLSWKVVGHSSGHQPHHILEFEGTLGLLLILKNDKMTI